MPEPLGQPTTAYEQHVRKWLNAHTSKGARRFEAVVKGTELELAILDVIGYDWWTGGGVTAKWVKEKLDLNPDVTLIRVLLDSPGGSYFDGIAIQNLLKRHAARVEVEVIGEASSAASCVAMGGDSIGMHEGTIMMVHRASSCVCGHASDMRTMAEALDKITESAIAIYTSRTGKTRDEVAELVEAETWMTPAEAVKLGFADSVVKAKGKAAPAKGPENMNARDRFYAQRDGMGGAFQFQFDGEGFAVPVYAPGPNTTEPANPVKQDHPVAAKAAEPITPPKETEPMSTPIALSILNALGLAASATEAECTTAIGKLKERDTTAGKFEQVTGASGDEAFGVIRAWKDSHDKLPKAQKELADIKAVSDRAELDALLDKGRADKKLTKAEADCLREQVEGYWKAKAEGKEPSEEHMSLAAAKRFVAVKAVNEVLAASPEQSKPTPGPAALKWSGKSYEALSNMERAELAQADEALFNDMRNDWKKRGEPTSASEKAEKAA